MRLDRFELNGYRLPYGKDVTWFNSTESAGDFLALRLFSEGVCGVAEATVKPTWCGLSPRAFADLLADVYVPALKDIDLSDDSAVRSALARFPGNPVAKALVASASAMLCAAAARQPLHTQLGGSGKVEVSWCITRQPPSDMGREAEDMVTRFGFRTLKVKGGQGMDTDRAALRAIRAAVGPDVSLTVDANGAYSRSETPRYLTLLAEEGVDIAEDPCGYAPDANFSDLVQSAPIPVLVDSPASTPEAAAAFIGAGAQALSVKPGRVGIPDALAIAQTAAASGVKLCSGMYAESALGTVISLGASSAIPHPFLPAEQTFFMVMREQVLAFDLHIRDGVATLPTEADLASLVDWTRTQPIVSGTVH